VGHVDREIHRRKSSRKFVARQERLWAEMDEAPNMKTGKEKKGDLHPIKKDQGSHRQRVMTGRS
jgi:hypothetical protein